MTARIVGGRHARRHRLPRGGTRCVGHRPGGGGRRHGGARGAGRRDGSGWRRTGGRHRRRAGGVADLGSGGPTWWATGCSAGTASWGELLRTLGFAQAPGILFAAAAVPFVGRLVEGLVSLWIVAAVIVALREALDVSTGRAVAHRGAGLDRRSPPSGDPSPSRPPEDARPAQPPPIAAGDPPPPECGSPPGSSRIPHRRRSPRRSASRR